MSERSPDHSDFNSSKQVNVCEKTYFFSGSGSLWDGFGIRWTGM